MNTFMIIFSAYTSTQQLQSSFTTNDFQLTKFLIQYSKIFCELSRRLCENAECRKTIYIAQFLQQICIKNNIEFKNLDLEVMLYPKSYPKVDANGISFQKMSEQDIDNTVTEITNSMIAEIKVFAQTKPLKILDEAPGESSEYTEKEISDLVISFIEGTKDVQKYTDIDREIIGTYKDIYYPALSSRGKED